MTEKNLGGRPHELTPELHEAIVNQFKETIVLSNVAGCVGKHVETIKAWIEKGNADHLDGKDTEFSRFSVAVKKALAFTIKNLEQKLLYGDEKQWQRFAWYLERCARRDYGNDSGQIAEFMALYEKLVKRQEKFESNPIKGVIDNG